MTNENDITLCKDCAFFLPDHRCGHPTAVIMDYVNGNHSRYDAKIHRIFTGKKDCGPGAQHFRPKMVDITPRSVPAQLSVVS